MLIDLQKGMGSVYGWILTATRAEVLSPPAPTMLDPSRREYRAIIFGLKMVVDRDDTVGILDEIIIPRNSCGVAYGREI